MATFVIVHGAFGGGWEWREVAALLRARGHDVFTPSLTGFGERVHLATPETGLETHIQDILNLLRYEDLHQVVLACQSYGGMVVTGVADRMPERLAHLVYLNALVPEDGQSVFDLLPPAIRQRFEEAAQTAGEGWRIPAPPFEDDPRSRPLRGDAMSPPRCACSPSRSGSARRPHLPRTYIWCTEDQAGLAGVADSCGRSQRGRSATRAGASTSSPRSRTPSSSAAGRGRPLRRGSPDGEAEPNAFQEPAMLGPAKAPPPRRADRRLAGGPGPRRTTSTATWRRSSTWASSASGSRELLRRARPPQHRPGRLLQTAADHVLRGHPLRAPAHRDGQPQPGASLVSGLCPGRGRCPITPASPASGSDSASPSSSASSSRSSTSVKMRVWSGAGSSTSMPPRSRPTPASRRWSPASTTSHDARG